MKVVVAGGGTGGHIFPAISLIKELERRKHQCFFLTDRSFKRFSNDRTDISVKNIAIRRMSNGMIIFLWSLIISCVQSISFILKKKPAVVVAFGGYATLPVLIAAYGLRVPIILHESNSILGSVNKIFVPMAKKLAFFFPSIKKQINKNYQHKLHTTGIPITTDIKYTPHNNIQDNINILVIGGSQGASIFSKVLPNALEIISQSIQKTINIVHQCPAQDLEIVNQQYKESNIKAETSTFFHDIPQRLSSAHIIICRAGASTIAELLAAGKAAIYVPYPYAKDNHQQKNAEFISNNGGGIMILQENFTSENLAKQLVELFNNEEKLSNLEKSAHKMSIAEADKKLADLVEGTITKEL